MLETTLIAVGAALGVFVMYFSLVAWEQRRGKRLLLSWLREQLDESLRTLRSTLLGVQNAPLQWTVRMQASVDRARSEAASRPVDQPRAFAIRPRSLRSRGTTETSENSHFATLQKHRSDTALTPKQAEARRKRHLEERF